MRSPNQSIFSLSTANQRQAHQRGLIELKPKLAVDLQESFELIFSVIERSIAPIQEFQWQLDIPMHELDRRLRSVPEKTCPQHGMATQNLIPGPLKSADIESFAKHGNQLLDIDARLRRRQAMDKHAVLYRRQGVRVFNLH